MNIKNFTAALCSANDRKKFSKWHIIWKGLCFYLLLMAMITIISNLCRKLFLSVPVRDALFNDVVSDILANRKWKIILQSVILAPVCEEIIFRLGLSFKKLHIAIAVAFLSFYMAPHFVTVKRWLSIEILVSLVIALGIFFMVFYCTKKEFWETVKSKYSKRVIYFTMFLFAAFHLINNTPLESKYIFNYLLIIIPHFIFAMTATYYRLNLGFIYCMLFHALCNGYKVLSLLSI